MWFDSDFSFSKHIQNVCKSCFVQLRDFRNIRQFLTHDAAVSVANAFVSSQLDYCKSLFRSLLRKLYWLPVQFHSQFKLATLVYKFIHTGFPKYFAPFLSTYHNTYNTRHSQSVANSLNVLKFQPKIHKSTKQFSFSFAFDAPTVWNSLPEDIHASPTIASFRKKSKPISMQRLIPLSSFSLMASPWC